jgi:fibronectin type 3 domain-containing protein
LILTPGQSATLDAIFAPATAGSLTGSVVVSSNASNSLAPIALSGDGTQAVAHSVSLAWSPSASAVTGYNVYRSEVSGGPYTKLDASAVSPDSYIDSSVQAGLTYYYVVTSVTTAGVESTYSSQAAATVPAS